WPVPVDEHRTRHLNFLVTYPTNAVHRFAIKVWYNAYYRYLHQLFLRQDRRQIEVQRYRQAEHLSNTDIALIQWRKLAPRIARKGGATSNTTPDQPGKPVDKKPGGQADVPVTNEPLTQ
ncbi:MAG: hypothetical protein GTO40_05835, partial [Deltaproteobacteria bacterium]|nr:hypothetical protein [Deltaproteobacteria bacterium]